MTDITFGCQLTIKRASIEKEYNLVTFAYNQIREAFPKRDIRIYDVNCSGLHDDPDVVPTIRLDIAETPSDAVMIALGLIAAGFKRDNDKNANLTKTMTKDRVEYKITVIFIGEDGNE